jgi:hypothetical protein
VLHATSLPDSLDDVNEQRTFKWLRSRKEVFHSPLTQVAPNSMGTQATVEPLPGFPVEKEGSATGVIP